jgi:hypothetical protein
MKSEEKTHYLTNALFKDGSAIDLLSGNRLVYWAPDSREIQIGSSVTLGEQTYHPAVLNNSIQQRLTLPTRVESSLEPDRLMPDLITVIQQYSALDDQAAFLVAAFVLSTWTLESLPSPPCLNLCGPLGSQTGLLALLACLCRRAVSLVDPNLRELSKLPAGVVSTLVLAHPSKRALKPLLATIENPGAALLHNGDFLHSPHATVLSTPEPASPYAIHLLVMAAGPTQTFLSQNDACALAERFQPRLLRYRLQQHRAVAASAFDVEYLQPGSRLIARTLGAALTGLPQQQPHLAPALAELDREARLEKSQNLPAFVLEVLLAFYHNHDCQLRVGQVAEALNALLTGRHEQRIEADRKVGDILRNQLGIVPDARDSRGYPVYLTGCTASRIHALAVSYCIPRPSSPEPCPLCDDAWPVRQVAANVVGAACSDLTAEGSDDHELGNKPAGENEHATDDVHDVPELKQDQATHPTHSQPDLEQRAEAEPEAEGALL